MLDTINLHIPWEKTREERQTLSEKALIRGIEVLKRSDLFRALRADIEWKGGKLADSKGAAMAFYGAKIYVNPKLTLSPEEWAHVIAHCMLHDYLGHYDRKKMYKGSETNKNVWNKACDIFVEQFLRDIHLGTPIAPDPSERYHFKLDDERKIYEKLIEIGDDGLVQEYGTAGLYQMDMPGLKTPIDHKDGNNPYVEEFVRTLADLTARAVSTSGGHEWDDKSDSIIIKAARWFVAHYPLLGGIAASFKIEDDVDVCIKNEVQIAAVDIRGGVIYANPARGCSEEEWRFILAHEYLHAGLQHDIRCQGRHFYIWNLATDIVINGWLAEMQVGIMPPDIVYDEKYKNMSAEAVYDDLMKDLTRSLRLSTFRGYHKGDITGASIHIFGDMIGGLESDDLYKNALTQGLEYHQIKERGYIPAGLIQEIRALSMPPINWKIELAEWFEVHFPIDERHKSYARPSRRQTSTPDIPRPGFREIDTLSDQRTFGVIIDTSGSMSTEDIGKALGAVASYAVSRDVRFVRVVFCDATAYDNGYMAAEDIARRVEVKGRGGTILQPAVNLLEQAEDFPPSAPILLITDGRIEERMGIHRNHAWLLPKGCKLPFKTSKPVFGFR